MRVLLVNANLIRVPPVAPYAIDVLGSALTDAGHDVAVSDLSMFPSDEQAFAEMDAAVAGFRPDYVAVSLRNTSDFILPSLYDLPTHGSFLPAHARVLDRLARSFPAERIVLGGSGFSTAPEQLLRHFKLRLGVTGPGERALLRLIEADSGGRLGGGPVVFDGRGDALHGRVRRTFVDNLSYYQRGGLAAVRTSNGCGMRCPYCVEPHAKGGTFQQRSVGDVLDEIDQLVELGIMDIHSADSEFNLPLPHAKRVLQAIIERGYPRTLRFWLYCQPHPFDAELAALMERAGVAGICFGSDHTDPAMLRAFHKWYTRDDIARTTELCKAHGIAAMHVLIFGSRGDTPDNMYRAIDDVWAMGPHVVGALLGLAVLPGTALAAEFDRATGDERRGFLLPEGGTPFIEPVFYADPAFRIPEIYADLRRHVGDRITSIMVTGARSTAKDTGQIVSSERVARQLASGIRGAYWYHYPALMSA